MKKLSVLTVVLCFFVSNVPLMAEDQVFLSLTKKADPYANLPTDISVITSDQIEQSGAKNAGEALENELGINRSVNGTLGQLSTVMLRGATSSETLVMIDGRRINSVAVGDADLSTIPVDNIERIEIVRGASSALYGSSAFGGLINIITKRPTAAVPKVTLSADGGTYNTQDYSLDFGVNKANVYGAVTASRDTTDGWRQNSKYQDQNFFGRLGYKTSGFGTFDLSASVYNNDLGVPGQALNSSGMPLTVDQYNGTIEKISQTPLADQKIYKDYVRLEHLLNINDSSIKTSIYSSFDQLKYDDIEGLFPVSSETDSTMTGAEVQLNCAKLDAMVGGEFYHASNLEKDLLAHVDNMNKGRDNGAFYFLKKVQLSRFSFLPALRWDGDSAFGSMVSPKLTVVYQANDNLKISANSGKAWRAPTFDDLYSAFGSNPNLRPEHGISSDLGASFEKNRTRVALTGYLTDTDDLITLDSLYIPQNISRSRQTGAEFELAAPLVGDFSQKFNYTYLWAVDSNLSAELNYKPRNRANYGVSFTPKTKTRVDLVAEYVGTQKTGSSVTPELKDYTLLNLRASQKIADLEIWGKIDNLTNVMYQNRLGYPIPGTVYSAGVKITFK